MVFQDLSETFSETKKSQNKIAPVTDRLLAVFFDFVLFTPIFTLVFSQLFKKLEIRYYTSPDSTEFFVLFLIAVIGLSVTTALTQAFFLSYFGYTPGKYIFKIRVISLECPHGKINFTQALLRSGLWVIEFFMLCIPFVEIFSQSKRQPLHDRAANTLVITLKARGDHGPHPLETHFVRNFLFLFICVFLFWGTLITTELYRMALRGDFKKQELENEKYLCSSVSAYSTKKTNRLDLALSQYLAGEVDEDCLLNEADFALWTDHSPQRAWAYLAKGMYYSFDKERAALYFQKTCSVEDKIEACEIAKALLGEKTDFQYKKESLTAKILEIKEFSARGYFEQAQYKIRELLKINQAFETFAQIESTKNLISLGKIDEAKGAYENTWRHMDPTSRQNFSSWYCLEELDRKCESRSYESCENLKSELKTQNYEDVNSEAVVALLRENECKKGNDLNMLTLHYALEADEFLKKYAYAISAESNWTREVRLNALREVAFRSEGNASRFLQRRAMISLLEKSTHESDFQAVMEYIEKSSSHDWGWHKVAGVLKRTSEQAGYVKTKQLRIPASQNLKESK